MYKLSKTSKMPGKSFSIPTSSCKMGSKLSLIEGSVCSLCYTKRGSYLYPNVKTLRQDNLDHYMENMDTFVSDLTTLIQAEYLNTGVPYFRWFDSGDLQNQAMLMDIIRIAYSLPHIKFWLPTKEIQLIKTTLHGMKVNKISLPSNLNIRISVFMINADYFSAIKGTTQSRVITKDVEPTEGEIVCSGICVACNYACWLSTKSVAYIKH